MDTHSVNVLLSTFSGLALPRTLSLSFSSSTPIREVADAIYNRLPPLHHPLSLTTTSNRHVDPSARDPLSTLLPAEDAALLPLRLRALVLGGKGGFGSQLRAAGGRMSSRKKRNQQTQAQNGSNRNLDGRRFRTVDAAKKLADYLTQKPEMEEREREERRKKWETVVEMANRREEDIKSGKTAPGRGKLSAEYVESKELAEDKTREAVIQAMKNGGLGEGRTGSESSMEAADAESDCVDDEESSDSDGDRYIQESAEGSRAFFGWDEEDDDDDNDDDDEDVSYEHGPDSASGIEDGPAPLPGHNGDSVSSYEGKGKGKAV